MSTVLLNSILSISDNIYHKITNLIVELEEKYIITILYISENESRSTNL